MHDAYVRVCLGVLRIVGDPSSGGDIALRLEANETVVSITAGSKNLTLIKPLDKEVNARRDEWIPIIHNNKKNKKKQSKILSALFSIYTLGFNWTKFGNDTHHLRANKQQCNQQTTGTITLMKQHNFLSSFFSPKSLLILLLFFVT